MRIIAGSAKATRLLAPPGHVVRPTPDRVKEALMSALGGRFASGDALDLCAGSGAIGLELLSRGFARACFVEPSEVALTALRANIAKTHMQDQADVLQMPAQRAIKILAEAGRAFDLAYIDPPWAADIHNDLVNQLVAHQLLRAGARIIVERQTRDSSPTEAPVGWSLRWSRKYGRCTLEQLDSVGI